MAKSAGFCFGVKRAVKTVYEQAEKENHLYTYGPIIHNEEVVSDLEKKGVKVLDTTEDLQGLQEGTVVIRSHGVPKSVCEMIDEQKLTCVDATCPFVKRIHNIVAKESHDGKKIVIVGNPGHPEVEGIIGWSETPVTVIETIEEAQAFTCDPNQPVCVVSQTTFNYNKFNNIVEIIKSNPYNVSIVNTICNATEERQRSARVLAREADVMIVIGGKHSSNTRKLYDICCEECANTVFLQTLDDLHLELPEAVRLVGITAGASTPNKLIEEVQNYVRINF